MKCFKFLMPALLIILGACAQHAGSPPASSPPPVAMLTTFDLATAAPADVGEALRRDGRVALRGITFSTDSTELSPASREAVSVIGQVLYNNPGMRLAVVGHTDDTGPFSHNINLSERRAQTIVNVLQQAYDINPTRLAAVGVGPLAPVASNDSEAGRAQNRRVELVLIE